MGFLWTAVWWLIIGAVVAPIVPGGWLTIAVIIGLSVGPLIVWTRRFTGAYPNAFVRRWVFRPFWYVQLGAPFVALAGVCGVVVGWPFGASMAMGRSAVTLLTLLVTIAGLIGYVGSRRLRVRPLDVRLPALPTAFDGMRVVQISDLHVGPHSSRRHLARIVEAVRNARPDLIAITGDQVDDYAEDVAHFAEAFGGLTAPDGVFVVPGNHDIYAGWPAVRAGLAQMGLTVLVNQALPIVRGADCLWILGTGDPAARARGHAPDAGAPDIDRALRHVPRGSCAIALAHNPALWPALARGGVSLTLSGHTHYGQISIPTMNWSLASVFLEHSMEWYREAQSLLYINPGTNYWGLPLRIGALPEVTVLTLRATHGESVIADAA